MKVPRVRLRRPGDRGFAALFFALLGAVLLHASLLGEGVLSTANTLYAVPPFQAVAPHDWLSHSNQLLSDAPYYYQPMLRAVRDALHGGWLPLWNPLIDSGAPLLGNQQSAPLSLVYLPVWILPFGYSLAVSAFLKVWLAGFGTYLLARRLRIGHWPALAAGTAFALGAFTIVWLSHGLTNVSVLLPWLLLTTEEIAHRPRPAAFIGHAVVTASFLLGGHPETAMFLAVGAVVYFAVRIVADGHRSTDARRRVAAFAGASLLGFGIAAVAVLPFLAELPGSVDSTARLRGQVAPRESFLTMLFPDWWGRPNEGSALGPVNYNERTFYAGAVMLVLAPLALLWSERRRLLAPVAAIGLLGVLASTDATRSSDLIGHLPGLRLTVLGRMDLLLVLAVALLGGAGIEYVARNWRARAPLVAVGAALAAGLAAVALTKPFDGQQWSRALRELVGLPGFTPEKPLVSPYGADAQSALGVLHLASALRWLVLVLLAGAAVVLARRLPRRAWLLAPALTAVVVLDMGSFADDYQPTIPKSEFYKPVPASIRFLQRHEGSQRFTATFGALPADANMHFGLRDIRGLDHPKPSRLYRFWKATLNPQQPPLEALGVAGADRKNDQVLSMMAVRYVLTGPDGPGASGRGFRRVYSGADARIWENRRALPRAYAAPSVRAVPGEEQAFRAVTSPDFAPDRYAVVEGAADPADTPARGRPSSPGRVTIRRDDRQEVDLDAALSRPSVVVVADSWSRGWEVSVDGRPAQALRTNYLYRGVRVGAGRHRIEWRYRPAAFVAGGVISALSLLALVVLVVAVLRRRFRARPPARRRAARP